MTRVEWIDTGTDVIARDAGVPLYLHIKHHGTPHYILCCAMMWVYYRAIPTEIGFDFALLQLPALHDLGQ